MSESRTRRRQRRLELLPGNSSLPRTNPGNRIQYRRVSFKGGISEARIRFGRIGPHELGEPWVL